MRCVFAPGASRSLVARLAVAAALTLPLMACSPTLDWREVAVDDTGLTALFPCRPSRFERQMTVAGASLKVFLLACDAGDGTYGVATAEVADSTQVAAVLAALADGAREAIGAPAVAASSVGLPGATPFPGAGRWLLKGRRPDGRAVEESVAVFARGTRVFQARVIRDSLTEADWAPFRDGLHFSAPR